MVAVAVLALHELRCIFEALIGSGQGVGAGALVPLLASLGALVLAARLVGARLTGIAPGASSLARLPLVQQLAISATAIAGLYLTEAVAESLLLAGAVGGLDVFTPGGLCVLPLALALAPICLFADRWFGRIEELVAAAGGRCELPSSPLRLGLPLASWPTGASISPLALGLARRGPPPSFG